MFLLKYMADFHSDSEIIWLNNFILLSQFIIFMKFIEGKQTLNTCVVRCGKFFSRYFCHEYNWINVLDSVIRVSIVSAMKKFDNCNDTSNCFCLFFFKFWVFFLPNFPPRIIFWGEKFSKQNGNGNGSKKAVNEKSLLYIEPPQHMTFHHVFL